MLPTYFLLILLFLNDLNINKKIICKTFFEKEKINLFFKDKKESLKDKKVRSIFEIE
jgi:hypothetical protein